LFVLHIGVIIIIKCPDYELEAE